MNHLRKITIAVSTVLLICSTVGAVDWPQFRGPARDGISGEIGLPRKISEAGLPILWSVKTGEGYAGPVIRMGRVYLVDYDQEASKDQKWDNQIKKAMEILVNG